MTGRTTLSSSDSRPLLETIDAVLVDLDGVVVLGDVVLPGAAETLEAVRRAGRGIAFVTNNAAREPAEIVARLVAAGASAAVDEVVTAAQAAAAELASELPPGAPVLVVGGPALHTAVTECGLTVVADAGAGPAAVVQGWGPDVGWRDLAEATIAVRAGARWVVTNTDRTLPTSRGALPGSGALVAAVAVALGRDPDVVVGKPHRPLFGLAGDRLGAPRRALMVGDRLDTDIGGAAAAGMATLLVLTGVSGAADLLAAPPGDRPDYLGRDLSAMLLPHPPVTVDGRTARCRSTTVALDRVGEVQVTRPVVVPGEGDDGLDALRALTGLAWEGSLPPECFGAALKTLDLT